jgi:DNA-directed RNA polymerase subunit E'/Rpb7
MTTTIKRGPLGNKRSSAVGNERKIFGVYIKSLLTSKVPLSITEVGKNIKQNLEAKIVKNNEGKCIAEGFVKPMSIKILTYSSGNVAGDKVIFTVVFECMISHPVEGMIIEADVKTITKAGIHAQVEDEHGNVPITIFVARDHHHMDANYNSIKENSKINIKVIGIRYELNDPYICVIAKLNEQGRYHGPTSGQQTYGIKKGGDLPQISYELLENDD